MRRFPQVIMDRQLENSMAELRLELLKAKTKNEELAAQNRELSKNNEQLCQQIEKLQKQLSRKEVSLLKRL